MLTQQEMVREEGGRRMEISIKARVQCTDGPGGEATHFIVHPATNRITKVIVREAQAPHVERIVPFRFVEGATADQIRLRCSRQEVSKMQAFTRTEFVKDAWSYYERMPAEVKRVKRLNIADDELAMDASTRVRATDSKAGRIDKLMVEPASGSVTHLVLREGLVWAPKAVAVPIAEVRHMSRKAVYLRTNRAGIQALPAVRVLRR
jgi:hypothetical protein